MINSEEKITKQKDSEILVTIKDIRTLTGTKHDDWHGFQKCDRKLHHEKLSDTYVTKSQHKNIFSMTRALQKCFQVTSEGEPLILKKI